MTGSDVEPTGASARCDAARRWLSAHRDGEAFDDPSQRQHTETCTRCVAWRSTIDGVTPRLRVRPTGSPDVVSAALARWDRRALPRTTSADVIGRVLSGLAGLTGLTFAVIGMLGVSDSFSEPGGHLGWELYSLEAVLSSGLLLAARSPRRYAQAMFPLVAAVVTLTFLPSAADAVLAQGDWLAELSHAAMLAGLLGLTIMLDARRRHGERGRPFGQMGGLAA